MFVFRYALLLFDCFVFVCCSIELLVPGNESQSLKLSKGMESSILIKSKNTLCN